MSHCLLLGLVIFALGMLGMAPMQCDLSVLVILQAAFIPHTQTSDCNLQFNGRPTNDTASKRRPQACLPCA